MKVVQRRVGGDLLAVPSSGYSQVIQRRTGGALLQAAPSSGYGHSSYNDGYHADHSDHYGSFSGHGSGCCPLVVDPLSYAALIGGIALATYFFQIQITNSMLMMARKKRRKRAFNLNEDIVNETINIFSEGKCRLVNTYILQ